MWITYIENSIQKLCLFRIKVITFEIADLSSRQARTHTAHVEKLDSVLYFPPIEATLNYLWEMMATQRDFWGLAESKHLSCLQENQEAGCQELEAGQHHLSTQESDRTSNTRKNSKYAKEKKAIETSQHWFMNSKLHLSHLIVFYNVMSSLVDEGRAVNFLYLDLRKTFD